MASVKDKVVFITGGARGVGAEVARQLHAKGAKLVLTDLDETPLHDLASDLGGVDVVIANAGVATFGSVLQLDPEAFKTLIDVNVVGVFNTVKAALPAVIDRRGYVLIVSSMAAFAAAPGLAPYSLAKAGVEHFANALRVEVAHLGVDVGSAHMSWIDTPLVQEGKAEVSSFNDLVQSLPGPLKKTTSVRKCGEAFVKGIESRKTHVYCPEWVGVLRWLRPVLATRVGERDFRKIARGLVAKMDDEAAALGRNFSARTQALETKSVK